MRPTRRPPLLVLILGAAVSLGTVGCRSNPSTSVDGGADVSPLPDTGLSDADPWRGFTVDEPFTTEGIALVETRSVSGYTVEYYRNMAYTCGRTGFHTFTIIYSQGLPLTTERPLWVRMHGGGVGAFDQNGDYVPANLEERLDEEVGSGLAGLMLETGLVTLVRQHAAGFRFLMPSLCDHDVYSGVGLPDPNNPYSPDENGELRAADGLLAAKAALSFTRDRAATTHIFLHGTSAGSIGAFSVAYTLERSGLVLSGIVMDSHVLSEAFVDLIAAGCSDYDPELTRLKIGPLTDPEHLPDRVVARGDITVPILHVWDRGDPGCCGETPYTYLDTQGVEQTLGACDYHHEAFRAAIELAPPGGASQNLRLCVNNPATTTPFACNMHSPTKIAFDEPSPPGDQDQGGADYNQRILEWVAQRLLAPPP